MSASPAFSEHTAPQITFFLRREQIKKATGFGTTTLWRLIKEKRFPAAVQLGPNSWGWRAEDYQEWAADPQAWAAK